MLLHVSQLHAFLPLPSVQSSLLLLTVASDLTDESGITSAQTVSCEASCTFLEKCFSNPAVVIAFQWWQVEKVNPIKLYEENKVIAGFSLLNLLFKQNRSGLIKVVMDKLLNLYNSKKIKPVVDSLWALEEVGAKSLFWNFWNTCTFRCKNVLSSY